jgi:4-aminobutyrate aminotransferase-like enzyme
LQAALQRLKAPLPNLRFQPRGLGLLAGVEFRFQNGKPATSMVLEITKRMLQQGYIVLPEGEHSNVISFTPPLTITRKQIDSAITALRAVLAGIGDRRDR